MIMFKLVVVLKIKLHLQRISFSSHLSSIIALISTWSLITHYFCSFIVDKCSSFKWHRKYRYFLIGHSFEPISRFYCGILFQHYLIVTGIGVMISIFNKGAYEENYEHFCWTYEYVLIHKQFLEGVKCKYNRCYSCSWTIIWMITWYVQC